MMRNVDDVYSRSAPTSALLRRAWVRVWVRVRVRVLPQRSDLRLAQSRLERRRLPGELLEAPPVVAGVSIHRLSRTRVGPVPVIWDGHGRVMEGSCKGHGR